MKKNIILLIVALALFMEALDTTIINTAIPAMANSLNVNPIDLKLALISYLLSLAIFIPISGWIADKFGIKKAFICAIIVFTVSSFWCGFTDNLWELVIARSIQGLGGSLTMPVGRLIMLRTFSRHEFINKMSSVVMVGAIGMMMGPVLGGVITHHFTWRWIFWVNVPVGIINVLLAIKLLKPTPSKHVPPLDKLGFIYFGCALATATLGTTMLSESDVANSFAFVILMISVLLFMCYIVHSRRRAHPVVKTQLFKLRTFQISIIGNLISRLAFGGIPFLLPLLLQIGLGYSSQTSGMIQAPTALGVLLMKPFALRLLRLFGYKNLLIFNTLLVASSIWAFATVNAETPIYLVACMTFIFGFLIAMQYSGMNSLAYAEVSSDDLSSATSIVSTMQQVAQSFGVAVAALFIRYFAFDPTTHNLLTPKAFHETFTAISLVTFISIFIFIRLKKNDGHELIDKEVKQNQVMGSS